MELLVNDLSIHEQFMEMTSFQESLARMMRIRKIAQSFGRELYCHRNLTIAQVSPTMNMSKAVHLLRSIDTRRAVMQWITRQGPYWEDVRYHGEYEWLEYDSDLVTGTAVGEAAWCCMNDIHRELVSFSPSGWQNPSIVVKYVSDSDERFNVGVQNHWDPEAIASFLETIAQPPTTWDQVALYSKNNFNNITFSDDAFSYLTGYPFASSAAQRLITLLSILNRLISCFDENGQRTSEGHEIYQNYFTGKKGEGGRGALFTDSSDREKEEFKSEMTFRHPEKDGQIIFCPWHGKVQTPQLRLHFSWPIRANEPLYVVYAGPKITKR